MQKASQPGGSPYHLGIKKDVKRSTISYANNNRASEVFEKLFYSELSTLHVNVAYITKMYSPKWNIEIFFKTIKQDPRIKKLYGQMENAVKTQIWIALICSLLFLKLPELCTYEGKNFTYFMLGIKVCLFERTDLFSWFVGYPSVRESSFCMAMQPELEL
ncbi:transposase [Treponema socranskii]